MLLSDMKKPARVFALCFAPLMLLAGCEREIESMPDNELAAKYSECLTMNDPAPAMIFACKNYKRECERRRKKGRYVC
jgi:hypothetical protein